MDLRLLPMALLLGSLGCTAIATSLDNRPCDSEGACLPGYRCDAGTDRCVVAIDDTCETINTPEACADCGDDCTARVFNAQATCDTAGASAVCDYDTCATGFFDADGDRANGCECDPDVEVPCNQVDDNCDGSDAQTSGELEHCNRCGDSCTVNVSNATGAFCDTDACSYATCDAGYGDADGDPTNGCECTQTGPEICDDADNDCDGANDNGVASCTCSSGPPALTEICDGVDNDCNDAIDDGFDCTGSQFRGCDVSGPDTGTESCNDLSCNWSGVCVPNDAIPPVVVADLDATGLDGSVDLTWTYPADGDLSECVIRRSTAATPANHLDGDEVATLVGPSPGGDGNISDASVSNGTLYYYAIFCRDQSGNWQETVEAGNSADATPVAIPPAQISDLTASDGEDSQSTIQFTTPAAPLDSCILLRRDDGVFPTAHDDTSAVQVGGAWTTPATLESVVDSGLTNFATYHYAAFCEQQLAWNDLATAGANADTGLPEGTIICGPPHNLTVGRVSDSCGRFGIAGGDAEIFHFRIGTDCNNILTALTIALHANSSSLEGYFSELLLVHDTNGDAIRNAGDTTLGSGSFASGTVSFTALNVALSTGATQDFFLVARFNTGTALESYFAVEISSGAGVTLTHNGQTKHGLPLTSPAHMMTGSGASMCAMAVPAGSVAPPSARALTSNNGTWSAGQGDDATWVQGGSSGPGFIDDCNLNTSDDGGGPLIVSDYGGVSTVLRVDTGVPIGLPMCGLEMRIYGSQYDPPGGDCGLAQIDAFRDAYLLSYDGPTTVAVASQEIIIVNWQDGGAPGTPGCNANIADFDLTTLYDNASGTTNLEVRLIFEGGGGISANDATESHIGELYVRMP